MVTFSSRSLLLCVSNPGERETLHAMLAREGHRVDAVCTAAEAVWHSNGATFYSGIIRDVSQRNQAEVSPKSTESLR